MQQVVHPRSELDYSKLDLAIENQIVILFYAVVLNNVEDNLYFVQAQIQHLLYRTVCFAHQKSLQYAFQTRQRRKSLVVEDVRVVRVVRERERSRDRRVDGKAVQNRAYNKVSQQLDYRREQRDVLLRRLESALGDAQDGQGADQDALVLSCTHRLVQQLQADAEAALMERREPRLLLPLDSSLGRGRGLRGGPQRLQGSALRGQQAVRRPLLVVRRHRTKKEDNILLPRADKARKVLPLIRLQHLLRALARLGLHDLRMHEVARLCPHDVLAQLRRLVHGRSDGALSARALGGGGLNRLPQARSLAAGQVRGPARPTHSGADLGVVVGVHGVPGSGIDLRTEGVHLRVDGCQARQPRSRGLRRGSGRTAHLEEAGTLPGQVESLASSHAPRRRCRSLAPYDE